jgi:hypothetical protein
VTTDRHAEIAAHRTEVIRGYLYQNDARYDDGWQTVTDIHRRIEADGWMWSAAVTRSLLNRMADAGTIVRETRLGRVRSGTPGIMNERQVRMYCLPTPAAATEPAVTPEPTPADSGDPVERARLFAAAYPNGTPYDGDGDAIIGRSAETAEVLVRDKSGREWWRSADMPATDAEADEIRGDAQRRAWRTAAYLSPVYDHHRATCSDEVSMLRATRALLMDAWDAAIVEHVERFGDVPVGFQPYPPVGQDCDTRTGWGGSLWCKLLPGHIGDHDPDPEVPGLRALARAVETGLNAPVRIEADLHAIGSRVDAIRRRVHSYDLTVPQAITELTGQAIGLTVQGAREVLSLSYGEPLSKLA